MKKIINRIVAGIVIGAFMVGIWQMLRYVLIDDTNAYARVTMHEYYEQQNIDVLFVGASLCYRSFNTQILDERLGANTFNLGTSSQELDASYYLIKDAVNRYDIDHIYLELSPIMALHMDIDARDQGNMVGTYIVSDYMKPSADKLLYLLGASKSDCYVNSFLVARRNWEKLFDAQYVSALLKAKSNSTYVNYEYGNLQYDTQWYEGKGYVASSEQVTSILYDSYSNCSFNVDDINEDWYKYLDKIIKCCKRNNVELTFLCAPLSNNLMVAYGENYDAYHRLIEEKATEAGIEFWDFNLCREEYFPINIKYYQDFSHLNMYGADKFSELVANLIMGTITYEDICYQTIVEKYASLEPMLCGVVYDAENKRIIANHAEMFEYRIYAIPNQGEEYLIQDFSSNDEFSINLDEHGSMHITARLMNNPSEVIEAEIAY